MTLNSVQTDYPELLNDSVLEDDQTDNGHELDSDQVFEEEDEVVLGNVREQAANILSRGEKKLLITALRLSQLPLLAGMEANNAVSIGNDEGLPLVLLDDITAELDERALSILLKSLSQLSCQVFITSLDDDIMTKIQPYWPEAKLFHMKQGKVIQSP